MSPLHLLQQPLAETVLLLYSFSHLLRSMVGARGHRSQTTQGLCHLKEDWAYGRGVGGGVTGRSV